MKRRVPISLLLVLVLAIGGCGDSGDGGGSGDASSLASIAPPTSPIFIEGIIRPKGELQRDVEAVAQKIAGIDDVDAEIISKLEEEAEEEGEPFDYETDVEPWLGERAGIFLNEFDGEDFQQFGVAIETTDPDAAQSFIEKQADADKDPIDDASYEGVEYKIDAADESVYGIVDDLVIVAEEEKAFKAAVDATNGDSLADEAAYGDAIEGATDGSLADIYVDVGLMIEQSGDQIDPTALKAFESAGIEPKEATAVASVVPGADQVEVLISSDLGDQEAPSGDASELLESLDSEAFAALAFSGFGDQVSEALDELDKEGIEGEVPPGQLKKGLKQAGIDLEAIAGSLEDGALFATGSSEKSLEGALVFTTDGSEEATEAISSIGDLLTGLGAAGVRKLDGGNGQATGFEVNSPDLGEKPLVVLTSDDRIAIGYGNVPAALALKPSKGGRLGDEAAYEEAVKALGETPITGYVDGPGALRLAQSLTGNDSEFREAKKYLRNISSIAIGSEAEGNRVTAKLIVGIE
ncbi:MAG TPA: DUF3352 domain-containing protein [Solirubrobacterales bacterium]|nr:DUF3352 domain-containing protein [Solirubrobacterales bacterium]